MADGKSLAAMLVDGAPEMTGRSPEMPGPHDEQGEELDEGQVAAAEELMEALQSGDARSFATALKAFLEMV